MSWCTIVVLLRSVFAQIEKLRKQEEHKITALVMGRQIDLHMYMDRQGSEGEKCR